MSDLLAFANSIQSKIQTLDETYQNQLNNPGYQFTAVQERQIRIIATILAFLFMILAFYLSWTRNTRLGETTGVKMLYGLLAALFGTTYLIFYMIRAVMEQDFMKKIRKSSD